MSSNIDLKVRAVTAFPSTPDADTIYFKKGVSDKNYTLSVTDSTGKYVFGPLRSLNGLDIRDMTKGRNIVYHELEPGGITDGLNNVILSGAASSATITKAGNYDEVDVTGGNTDSFIAFPDKVICDNDVCIELRVRVANLNKDAITGTSWIGIGSHGVQNAKDTGTLFRSVLVFDLQNRTGVMRGLTDTTVTLAASPGVLGTGGVFAIDNDILHLKFKRSSITGRATLIIHNETAKTYVIARTGVLRAPDLGLQAGILRLVVSNATYTILKCESYSSAPENPFAVILSDSFSEGYNAAVTGSLQAMMTRNDPHAYINFGGNGAYMITISKMQLPQALLTGAKYGILISELTAYWGTFRTTHADHAAYTDALNAVFDGFAAAGIIPVMYKYPAGGVGSANRTDYNLHIDAIKTARPELIIIDMTGETFDYADAGHPSNADFTKQRNLTDAVLNPLN